MNPPAYGFSASNTRQNWSPTAADGKSTNNITNGNGGRSGYGGDSCWPLEDGPAGFTAQPGSSSGSFGVGVVVGFHEAGSGNGSGSGGVCAFGDHATSMSNNGGFDGGFGGDGGGVPHETDDITDILDVGLLKGLGECR